VIPSSSVKVPQGGRVSEITAGHTKTGYRLFRL
jgi:hypothetical protein